MANMIIPGTEFNPASDFVYTKAKSNNSGGKQVGILNNSTKKTLYVNTPLMLTWGVNEYVDEKSGRKTYDMALQFPIDEYNSPECTEFLKNMQALEQKIKEDAIANSKDWLNKTKVSAEAVDALWTPMLKYPKDKNTDEPDYSRPPTLKVKIPYWEGEFKVELYNNNQELVFPTSDEAVISDYLVKASNVATIIQCGGIWVAAGRFGVTWRLFQAVVQPKASLSGKCHITLSQKDKDKMAATVSKESSEDDVVDEAPLQDTARVEDTDDEEEVPTEVKEEVAAVVESKSVVTEDVPKKKRVVKKKSAE